MVYELLQDCFVPDDSASGFDFLKDMWAHHLWSCFSINIMFAYCIATIGFGETS
jgi:hypothetical protein